MPVGRYCGDGPPRYALWCRCQPALCQRETCMLCHAKDAAASAQSSSASVQDAHRRSSTAVPPHPDTPRRLTLGRPAGIKRGVDSMYPICSSRDLCAPRYRAHLFAGVVAACCATTGSVATSTSTEIHRNIQNMLKDTIRLSAASTAHNAGCTASHQQLS